MSPEHIKEILDHLSQIPVGLLYLILAGLSALENIIPPLPTDLFVAFGSFIAARGQGNPWISFAACFLGNMLGAGFTYYIGRKYGPSILIKKFEKLGGAAARDKIEDLYARYGMIALFISRFLPGVRAMVPPVAGALRFNPIVSFLSFGLASGLWYAFVTVLAFRAGSNFDVLYGRIIQSSKYAAYGAVGLVALGLIIWLIRRNTKDKIKLQ